MRHRTRKRLALLVLVLGVPLWIVAAVSLVGLFDRPPFWLELAIYIGLGVLWIFPLKRLFLGVAQPDPAEK
jgi:predicted membrane channel-forming protein YqfA (hemolysin III family)